MPSHLVSPRVGGGGAKYDSEKAGGSYPFIPCESLALYIKLEWVSREAKNRIVLRAHLVGTLYKATKYTYQL